MRDTVWAEAARHELGDRPGRADGARRAAKRGRAWARVALLGLIAVVAVAGCSQDEAPAPVPVDLAWEVPPGVELACGMDAVAVETAISLPVGAVEGSVTGEGSATHGSCDIWPGRESTLDGPMLTVQVLPSASDEGRERRADLTGDAPGVREPAVRYEDPESAVWFMDLGTGGGQTVVGGISVVVMGDHVVALTSRRNDPDRDAAADLLALSQQVAASYGLVEARG